MWKFIKIAFKFIVIWKFSLWWFDLLKIPIVIWIFNIFQKIENILNISWNWIKSGSDGAIITIIFITIIIIIATPVILVIRYEKKHPPQYSYWR